MSCQVLILVGAEIRLADLLNVLIVCFSFADGFVHFLFTRKENEPKETRPAVRPTGSFAPGNFRGSQRPPSLAGAAQMGVLAHLTPKNHPPLTAAQGVQEPC